MKYLCLVYLDEKRLDELPDEDCVAYDTGIRKSGHCIASEALESVQTATTVRVRNGKVGDHRRAIRRDQGTACRLLHDRGQGFERSHPARIENPAGAGGQHRGAADPADSGNGRSGRNAEADEQLVEERNDGAQSQEIGGSSTEFHPRAARDAVCS